MRKVIMLGFALVMSVALMAQRNERPDMSKMAEHRATQLSKSLELKDEAKTQFEVLYAKYFTELMGERQEHERTDERGNDKKDKKLTAEEATERLQKMLERQERQIADQQRRLEVQKKYVAEFSKVLTPQQIWKVMRPQQRQGGQGQGRGNGPRIGGQHMGGHNGFGGGPNF